MVRNFIHILYRKLVPNRLRQTLPIQVSGRTLQKQLTCIVFIIILVRAAIDGIEKKGNDKKSTNLGGPSLNENESFNRHYNTELKVSEGNYNQKLSYFR